MSPDPITTIDADPSAEQADRHGPRTRRTRVWGLVLAGVLLFAGIAIWTNRSATNPAIAGSRAVTADELEQRYGVRLGVLGLLASGGLVEVKFQVTDADKATALFGKAEDMPVLAVQGSDQVLGSAKGMKHNMELHSGATYFFLYTNVSNALHAGSEVAFVINGVRLPDLVVQQ